MNSQLLLFAISIATMISCNDESKDTKPEPTTEIKMRNFFLITVLYFFYSVGK